METGNYYYGARYYDPKWSSFISVDPLAEKYPSISGYAYCANNPVIYVDPDGRDWVEAANGDITWRKDVTADNYKDKGVLGKGEIYRGTTSQRDKIWSNVNVNGNIENGLMSESYNSNGKMTYSNQTPWIDKAFEELGVARMEGIASNPRIEEYLSHTQLTGGSLNDATSWCAGFVNWAFETGSDVKGTGSAMALSFNDSWGQSLEKPAYGSVATISYGGGKGYVGFVVGINSSGKVLILGGNQGSTTPGGQNEVNISPNNPSSFKYHYPNNLTPSNSMPTLNITGKSLNYGTTR